MKLIYRIVIRLLLILTVILTVWGIFFYITVIDEINDEIDDALEDYSENIIIRALAGQPLPSHTDGSNNSYFLSEVSETYADQHPHIRYSDEKVYIPEKKETEPARILKTIFKNGEGHFFELTVSIPSIEKGDLKEAILYWIIILYFVLLIIVLLTNVWVFYGSLKPLYALLKWLDQYTIGQTDTIPESKTNITEFNKLYEAANRSIQRNQAIYEAQKQFIGNASHELQTPLAICQNRLEMLVDSEKMTEEQLSEINKIQETLSYIIRLNKSLLLLSKIESGQFQENQDILVNRIIYRQLEDYNEIFSYKHIVVNVKEEDDLWVHMNETLATTLVSNLLKNAYTHNIPCGQINITVSSRQLSFSNTGNGGSLEPAKIFQRFYQGKHSGQGSSGLGLSIAKAICELYDIRLNYSYTGEHRFELHF